MEKVATYSFTVPLAEVPVMYKGGFTSVTLAKPAYAPGASIRMIVKVWTWTSARWLDLLWGSIIIAYNAAGKELTRVAASHIAVPGVDDSETYDVDLNLGTQPTGGLSGRLELWCEGSPAVKVATASFGVPVITDGIISVPPERVEPADWLPWVIGIGALALLAQAPQKKGKK
ncbi:MAG: hypothetical protein KKF98_16880 [Bacteroidetes bacterium]|nr:hypothetical protein [Bacteroidota bacterium]